MIFPRTRRGRNQKGRPTPLIACALLIGCHSLPPAIPPNVVIPDAHAEGYVLDFNRDGTVLASGGVTAIRLWRIPAGSSIRGWSAHTGVLRGLVFIEDDRVLLSASEDATLARWTLDGKLLKRQTSPSPINDMAHDETGERVFTAHDDGTVRTWSTRDLSLLAEQKRHPQDVDAVAWHGPTRQLASAGEEGEVIVSTEGGPVRHVARPPLDLIDLAFSPDGRMLIGSTFFSLYRWQLPEGNLAVLPTEHSGSIPSVTFTNDGRKLVTISREFDSAVLVLNPQDGKTVTRLQSHDLCGAYVRLSRDGRYLATTSDDASIRLWDMKGLLPATTYSLSLEP